MKKFIPAIIWALIIGVLSLTSSNKLPKVNFWDVIHADKIGHAVFYMILAGLICLGFNYEKTSIKKIFWISGIISILYGIILESLQFFMSFGRVFEILDIIANISGALIGLFIFNHLTKRK